MNEISVIIKAFNHDLKVNVLGFENMPGDRLKTLAINKLLADVKECILNENNLSNKASISNPIECFISEEFKLYTETLKGIITREFDKEMVFYEMGKWYSRYHGDYITPEELCDFVIEMTTECEANKIRNEVQNIRKRNGLTQEELNILVDDSRNK